MRKLITWIVVTVGIAALVRKLRSRGSTSPLETPSGAEDPADQLREKLASSREAGAGAAEAADASEVVEPPTPEPSSEPTIDARRADVHDEGRAAIDEMRQSAED